jgi:hypothetical protein
MKGKKYFLLLGILFSLVLVSSMTSAAVTVNYNINERIFEEDGSVNNTNTPVKGASLFAYYCANSDCSTINPTPFYSYNAPSSSNEVTLILPKNLVGNGYAFYVIKEGYIGWHHWGITYAGSGTVNEPNPIYLSKKRSAFAPITNFSVYNEVERNKPIQIEVSVGIDATTASAIEDIRHIQNLPLQESVMTLVSVEIKNSSGSIVHSDTKLLSLAYSERQSFYFNYPGFDKEGNYNVSLYTDIVDDKILNPIRTNANFEINVLGDKLLDYSYSLLEKVSYEPLHPKKGEVVNISFGYLSNYVDSEENLFPINTSITAIASRNNQFYESFNFNLKGNSVDFSPFSFDFLIEELGNYTIKIIANPNPEMGNFSIGTNATLEFFVLQELDQTPPTIIIHSPINITYIDRTQLVSITALDNVAVDKIWYNWNGTNISYNGPVYVDFLEGSNTLKVWANDTSGNVNSASVVFDVVIPCIPDIKYTEWSEWINENCAGDKRNQSRFRVQYDANNCGFCNFTHYEYQLVEDDSCVACVPNQTLTNSVESDIVNLSCINNTHRNQSYVLTNFYEDGCGSSWNVSSILYRLVADSSCYVPPVCEEDLQYTEWSSWTGLSCVNDTHRNQSRFRVQYDANDCGNFVNVTEYGFRTIEDASCVACVPNATLVDSVESEVVNLSCVGDKRNQSYVLTDFYEDGCGSSWNVSSILYRLVEDSSCHACVPNQTFINFTETDVTNLKCVGTKRNQSYIITNFYEDGCGSSWNVSSTLYRLVKDSSCGGSKGGGGSSRREVEVIELNPIINSSMELMGQNFTEINLGVVEHKEKPGIPDILWILFFAIIILSIIILSILLLRRL